jgi:hypothetical protein
MLGYVTAEAEAKGDPRLKAGVVVKIVGMGDRFNGDYLIVGRHTGTRTWVPDPRCSKHRP